MRLQASQTDLKERLAAKLFGTSSKKADNVVSFPFARLSEEETELVNAARGLDGQTIKPDQNK